MSLTFDGSTPHPRKSWRRPPWSPPAVGFARGVRHTGWDGPAGRACAATRPSPRREILHPTLPAPDHGEIRRTRDRAASPSPHEPPPIPETSRTRVRNIPPTPTPTEAAWVPKHPRGHRTWRTPREPPRGTPLAPPRPRGPRRRRRPPRAHIDAAAAASDTARLTASGDAATTTKTPPRRRLPRGNDRRARDCSVDGSVRSV